jgi:triosephosphate isomerase
MLIAGNWKMFKGPAEVGRFFEGFDAPAGVDVVFCPPFVSLAAAVESGRTIYAQNVHWEGSGPYTGEISPEMLLELGVEGALVGHSERRQLFGDTDEMVARRTRAALEAGLAVIACVGETLEQRESGDTELVLKIQVEAIAFAAGEHERLVIAYEPVWAIGTGRNASGADAAAMAGAIRNGLRAIGWGSSADDIPILYGGSVTAANIGEFLAEPSIDGALVGGASLKPDEMAGIVARAGVTADARRAQTARS